MVYLLTIRFPSYLILFHHAAFTFYNKQSRSYRSTIRSTAAISFWRFFFGERLDTVLGQWGLLSSVMVERKSPPFLWTGNRRNSYAMNNYIEWVIEKWIRKHRRLAGLNLLNVMFQPQELQRIRLLISFNSCILNYFPYCVIAIRVAPLMLY